MLSGEYVVGEAVDLSSYDANVVASLLKLYLRELPDSLLTSRLQDRFEQVTSEFLSLAMYIQLCVCVCVCVPARVCVCACKPCILLPTSTVASSLGKGFIL